jgi:hypothetical protein
LPAETWPAAAAADLFYFSKKEGEKKGNARGSVHWGCYYATALDNEVDSSGFWWLNAFSLWL